MSTITIKTADFSYTGLGDARKENYIFNATASTTIGGVRKVQADTRRIIFDLFLYVDQSDLPSLMEVLEDYDTDLYIKTNRALLDFSSDTFIKIIISDYDIDEIYYNGETVYTLVCRCEEVI